MRQLGDGSSRSSEGRSKNGSAQQKNPGDPWETESWHAEPIGRVAGAPLSGKWNRWIWKQGEVWINRENQVFLIQDMPPRYCFNVLRFLFWNHWDDEERGDPYQNPLIKSLVLRIRGVAGQDDPDSPRRIIEKAGKELPVSGAW